MQLMLPTLLNLLYLMIIRGLGRRYGMYGMYE